MQHTYELTARSDQAPPLEGEALDRFHDALPFVESIAKTFIRKLDSRHQLDELVGAGREGLLEAVRRFDPFRGASFKGYAYLRIRGEIVAHLRRTQLSRRAYEKTTARLVLGCEVVHHLGAAEFEVANGTRHAVGSEVAAEATLDDALSRYATAAALAVVSTSATEDALVREEAALRTPEFEYEKRELVALLKDEVDRLPCDEATVVKGLYFQQLGLTQVATQMECDKSWASRLHRRAVERLTKRMRASAC
jgi:RNA polymerase sigma factor for flagellar operon FliA